MLRKLLVPLLLGVLFGLAVTVNANSHEAQAQLASLINAERAGAQLPPQSTSAALTAVAQLHANYMAATDNVTHYAADGGNVVTRSQAVGYPGEVNEIIFGGVADPASIVKWWMNSPSHRDIIMTGTFSDIGVATAINAETGWTYWCVVFGTPPADAASADIAFTPVERVDSDTVRAASESTPSAPPAPDPPAVAASAETDPPPVVDGNPPAPALEIEAAADGVDGADRTAPPASVAAAAADSAATHANSSVAALGGNGGHTGSDSDLSRQTALDAARLQTGEQTHEETMTASTAIDPVHVIVAAGALLGAVALLLAGYLRPGKRRDQFLPPY